MMSGHACFVLCFVAVLLDLWYTVGLYIQHSCLHRLTACSKLCLGLGIRKCIRGKD